MVYQEIVDKLGVAFEEKPVRVKILSDLIEKGRLEEARRLASIYSRMDAKKADTKRVEVPLKQAERFFELKKESDEKAEQFIFDYAQRNKPVGFEPDSYEFNEGEKKVAVIYKKEQRAKDRRPPKEWWDNCIKRAEKFADDPARFCGALWHNPEQFPQGEKLKESFGKPYRGSILQDYWLKKAVESFTGKRKERRSFWDRIAFWKKKKAVDEEAMKTEYRTHEERKHPDYSSEGKGEGKWEDYKTSRYAEASLRRLAERIERLKKKIREEEEMIPEEEPEVRKPTRKPFVRKRVPIEEEEEEIKRPTRKPFVRRRIPIEEEEEEVEIPVEVRRRKSPVLEEEEETPVRRPLRRPLKLEREKVESLMRRIAALKNKIKEWRKGSLEGEKLASLKRRIERIKSKLSSIKKKAVFDPRILTDLEAEKGFGPLPEMAAEKPIPKHKYEIGFAHEEEERIKKPIPETAKMVAEKPPAVEKAMIEKISRVAKLVDKMLDKGIIMEKDKYNEMVRLVKLNDFELSRIERFVDEVKDTKSILVVDEGFIDLEKVVGD